MADAGEHQHTAAPAEATGAVLVPSEPVPAGAREVHGIDFDAHGDVDVTAAELVAGMAHMGFQATALSDAVRIINHMVRPASRPRRRAHETAGLTALSRGPGPIPRRARRRPSSSATRPT
jgi:hypothetical protein